MNSNSEITRSKKQTMKDKWSSMNKIRDWKEKESRGRLVKKYKNRLDRGLKGSRDKRDKKRKDRESCKGKDKNKNAKRRRLLLEGWFLKCLPNRDQWNCLQFLALSKREVRKLCLMSKSNKSSRRSKKSQSKSQQTRAIYLMTMNSNLLSSPRRKLKKDNLVKREDYLMMMTIKA